MCWGCTLGTTSSSKSLRELTSKNEKSRVRYRSVKGLPWKVSEGINKDGNFRISAYMILIHVVGLSIASRFLQIGWQKSMLTNFELI